MKVSIIGASGKVGKQTIQNLLYNNRDENLELVLIANNTDRIEGTLADVKSAMSLAFLSAKEAPVWPRIVATNDITNIQDSDLVVLSAGAWASPEEKEAYKKIDPSGRLVQSHMNFSLVHSLAEKVSCYAKNSHVIVVTNQSDMMSETAREVLKSGCVLGMGGVIDTARFRMLLAEKSGINQAELQQGNHIIGYHNSDMMPLSSSLSPDLTEDTVSSALKEAKAYGAFVSKLQKDFNYPNINSGASVLPGYAVSAAIAAFTGQLEPIEFSFNTVLDAEVASTYGVEEGVGISVPIILGKRKFEVVSKYHVSYPEQTHLKEAQERMHDSYKKLKTSVMSIKKGGGGAFTPSHMKPK